MRHVVPDSPAEAFIALLCSDRSQAFVANLETRINGVALGDGLIPCTTSDGVPTCYLCCPSMAYVAYARAELKLLGVSTAAEVALAPLLALGRVLVRVAGLDRQVQPNNWLIATNPAPRVPAGDLQRLVDRLVADHPGHVVLWRSLDARSDNGLLATMRREGWLLLPARMVYVFDCRDEVPRIGRDEARDAAMLREARYEIIDGSAFGAADFTRAAALYRMLYVDKYTRLNPHYTPAFIAGLVRAGLLDLRGLRAPGGAIDGIVGFFDGDGVMTAPVVGYDTALPQGIGLYRMLMAIAFDRARRRRMLFNASAGADSFKRNRGAVPILEYSALYNRHLPLHRRAAAQILASLLTRIGVPLLETYVA